MKKIIKLLCVTLSLLLLSFSATACDKEEYSYWQITAKQVGEVRLTHVAELSFGSSNIEITEVWANISGFKAQSTTITLIFTKTSSSKTTKECAVTSSQIKNSEDGWIQLYFGDAITCKSVTVEIVDTMKMNEMYFVKSDAKSATPTFTKGGVRASNSANLYTKAELEKLTESDMAYSENPSFNVIDEQDKFPVEKIQTVK